MRRPIVSTHVDGLGEVLNHDEDALLVPPRNSEKLASAIESLINDSQKRERLASQAMSKSLNFDIQNTVGQMEQIYDELVNLS
jgi:glycosyltransferase involved in cell wall biosynthesis